MNECRVAHAYSLQSICLSLFYALGPCFVVTARSYYDYLNSTGIHIVDFVIAIMFGSVYSTSKDGHNGELMLEPVTFAMRYGWA